MISLKGLSISGKLHAIKLLFQMFFSIQEKEEIISTCLSNDNKYLFINVSHTKPEIHMWKLNTLELVSKFSGHK